MKAAELWRGKEADAVVPCVATREGCQIEIAALLHYCSTPLPLFCSTPACLELACTELVEVVERSNRLAVSMPVLSLSECRTGSQ
jgi:hypothetical protein